MHIWTIDLKQLENVIQYNKIKFINRRDKSKKIYSHENIHSQILM